MAVDSGRFEIQCSVTGISHAYGIDYCGQNNIASNDERIDDESSRNFTVVNFKQTHFGF